MKRGLAWILGGCLLLASCGDTPTKPSTVNSGGATLIPLAVTCPASMTTATGLPSVPVAYAPAATTGGTQPTTASCTPASGSTFAKGSTTTVTCTGSDSGGQTATCSFSITVQSIPLLKGTNFVAFGDSFTAGEVLSALRKTVVTPEKSYPTQLLAMLTSRYAAQLLTVPNYGLGGEELLDVDPAGAFVRKDETARRFRSSIVQERPDALLLLEGINDLNNAAISPESIAGILGQMVQEAYAGGVKVVYLATEPPQIPGHSNSGQAARVPALNAQIRAVAAQQGATLVDLYAAMIGDVNNLINPEDGLHPYPAGYVVMAQTFFTAIKGNFEQSGSLTTTQRIIH